MTVIGAKAPKNDMDKARRNRLRALEEPKKKKLPQPIPETVKMGGMEPN